MRILPAFVLAVATTACGGPASCPLFDEECQSIARFAQEATGVEAANIREVPCGPGWDRPPARCWEYEDGRGNLIDAALFPDGAMQVRAQ